MTPILWTFRRCPYAIRARLAVAASGLTVEHREILLRDKPEAFRNASPTATVPCLETDNGSIDESLDIMLWALRQSDPEHWLEMPAEGMDLIAATDGPFKTALDRTKYHTRHDTTADAERPAAMPHLQALNARLAATPYLFGDTPRLADMAILPFVRQFAHIDRAWFDAQDWPHLIRWLDAFLASPRFTQQMIKRPLWRAQAA
ncbi:glutathione S-transferase [Alphaproteobacteria bacterium KMM 3653]|uniref:Glutathione S-transferase n=1 Tax=Harenicola maris TaxID=2841044 RepID=A0AAP2CQA2_9RHOB|nr:glutathione S-transferase [Harenicola maris]